MVKYLSVIFVFYSNILFSQNIIQEINRMDSINYLYYSILLYNNTDSILVLNPHPTYNFNTEDYEELIIKQDRIFYEYNVTFMKRFFNIIVMPHQSTRIQTENK